MHCSRRPTPPRTGAHAPWASRGTLARARYSAGSLCSGQAASGEDLQAVHRSAFFIEKVRDIGGLYLNPPDHAMVLCVDEKSQIQALNRTQPTLRWAPRAFRRRLHPRLRPARHDDVDAALDTPPAGDRPVPEAAPPRGVPGVPAPLIDREVPAELDIHLVLDNYATHKHAKQAVAGGAATLPSALHTHLRVLVEPGGAVVRVARASGRSQRGSFRSVADLVRKIQAFIGSYNASGTPFVWVATAQSIIDKVARIAMRISGTAH